MTRLPPRVRSVHLAITALLTLAACPKAPVVASPDASAAPIAPVDAGPASTLPADVEALREHAESCEHWLGEEPYDKARGRDIAEGVRTSCGALKQALPALTTKYAGDEAVMATLAPWAELVADL